MAHGTYLLRVQCMRTPIVVLARQAFVRAYSDIETGAILLLQEQLPLSTVPERPIRYGLRLHAVRRIRERTDVSAMVLEFAAIWPLQKPFHLREAVSDAAIYDGPCPLQRLTNEDHLAIYRDKWVESAGVPVDTAKRDLPVCALFHKLWSSAGTPRYDKEEWRALANLLNERGVIVW